MTTIKIEVWVNVYDGLPDYFDSEAEAVKAASSNCLAIAVKLEKAITI